MQPALRVLIADDHDLFRDGIASLLEAHGYEVVGQANDGQEAVARARDLHPDLVLMDIRMPNVGGLEATRLIKAEMPAVKVVILTVSDEEEDLFEAIKSGAQGYLLKNLKTDTLLDLLSGVARGEAPISPRMAAKMLEELSGRPPAPGTSRELDALSEREIEVLRLIAQGRLNKEVAATLFISESTVKYHLRNILEKLHLENRGQVIAFAARHGLTDPQP